MSPVFLQTPHQLIPLVLHTCLDLTLDSSAATASPTSLPPLVCCSSTLYPYCTRIPLLYLIPEYDQSSTLHEEYGRRVFSRGANPPPLLSARRSTVLHTPDNNVAFSPSTAEAGSSHRRRLSRSLNAPSTDSAAVLSPTLGSTPFHEDREDEYNQRSSTTHPMSLSRSPSPRRDGGWSSPGLTTPFDETNGRSRSPRKPYGGINGGPQGGVTWASAKANSARVNGYPSYQSQNQGFFSRHMRNLSESLPYFAHGGQEDRLAEKEKAGRGRHAGLGSSWADVPRRIGLLLSRRRKYAAMLVLAVLAILLWFSKRELNPLLLFFS